MGCVCGLGPVVVAPVCPEVLTPGGSLRDRVPPGRALLVRPSPRGSAAVRSRPGLLCAAGVRSCGLDAPRVPRARGTGLIGLGPVSCGRASRWGATCGCRCRRSGPDQWSSTPRPIRPEDRTARRRGRDSLLVPAYLSPPA
ncbi:hypothetical protein NDU88_001575 [Pleurodeles waltl]|uniref:Uncharacterized protein n=1 Tax=Pleurodeles waltl TaxID=8319 RepID=A0AAV7P4A2_PLEWA|nr:hypothetical protein NDU88_001575 [Pleurodeles waltl]